MDSVLPDIQSIGDGNGEILDTVLKDELRLLYDEAMNRIIIKKLSHGLSVGRIEGYTGGLSLSNVSTSILEDGLMIVDDKLRLLETVQNMIYTAKLVRDVRKAVMGNMWDKVTLQLESYRNKKSMIYEFAFDELDLVQDEANNRKILKILGSGLS